MIYIDVKRADTKKVANTSVPWLYCYQLGKAVTKLKIDDLWYRS